MTAISSSVSSVTYFDCAKELPFTLDAHNYYIMTFLALLEEGFMSFASFPPILLMVTGCACISSFKIVSSLLNLS